MAKNRLKTEKLRKKKPLSCSSIDTKDRTLQLAAFFLSKKPRLIRG